MTLGTAAAGVVTTGGGTYFCAENNFDTSSVDYVEKVMG